MLNSDLLSFEKSPLFIPTFSALQDFLTFAGIFDLKSNQVNILFAPNDFKYAPVMGEVFIKSL